MRRGFYGLLGIITLGCLLAPTASFALSPEQQATLQSLDERERVLYDQTSTYSARWRAYYQETWLNLYASAKAEGKTDAFIATREYLLKVSGMTDSQAARSAVPDLVDEKKYKVRQVEYVRVRGIRMAISRCAVGICSSAFA